MYIVTYKVNVDSQGDDTSGTAEYKERYLATIEEVHAVKAALSKDASVSDIRLTLEL
jgi:hypothetical protein